MSNELYRDFIDRELTVIDNHIVDIINGGGIHPGPIPHSGHNYSTTEHMVGTWVDGTPVYEKTIYIASITPYAPSQFVFYPHNITNFDKLINIFGVADTGALFLPLPYVVGSRMGTSAIEANIGLSANNTDIGIIVGQDRTALSVYITIQYTKTTN
jgi:hypothetical protein